MLIARLRATPGKRRGFWRNHRRLVLSDGFLARRFGFADRFEIIVIPGFLVLAPTAPVGHRERGCAEGENRETSAAKLERGFVRVRGLCSGSRGRRWLGAQVDDRRRLRRSGRRGCCSGSNGRDTMRRALL